MVIHGPERPQEGARSGTEEVRCPAAEIHQGETTAPCLAGVQEEQRLMAPKTLAVSIDIVGP
jgi:hypothetical protein